MVKIAAFASGSGTNVEALVNNGVNIDLLICNKANSYVIERAKKLGIKYHVVITKGRETSEFESEMLEILKDNNIELILLAGYMRMIGNTLLDEYEGNIINIHPSLLPSFKGAHAIDDAFNYGIKVSGITVHFIDSKMDEGTIIMQAPVVIENNDTIETFEAKMHEVEYDLYHRAVKKVLKEKQ